MILVFGSGGQLGQELGALSRERGIGLQGLPRSAVDIAEPDQVARALDENRPALVVNAGAYTKVDRAESEVAEAHHANETGPAVLASACAAFDVPLIHLSTDYVFDGEKTSAYVESDPVAPASVYGRTKAAGEGAIRARHRLHLILRTSWVYGIYGQNLMKTAIRLAQERNELRFVADQRGCPTATFDLADAILRISDRVAARESVWGTYHFAGTGVTTWHGFVSRVVAAQVPFTGRNPPVRAITTAEFPTAARRPQNSELDCSRFLATFGFAATPWAAATDRAVGLFFFNREAAR